MKMLNSKLTLIILFSIIYFAGCKKDNSSSSTPSTSSIITTGTWHVSYYHESGDDHTSNFSGYTFIFNSNGNMTATDSGGTTNGTWTIDDSHNEMHMTIGTASPLSDLSNGWTIISKSSTQLNLKDDNSSHSEELHFTKN